MTEMYTEKKYGFSCDTVTSCACNVYRFSTTFAVCHDVRSTYRYRYRVFHTFKCVLWPWKKYQKIDEEKKAWRQNFRVEVVTVFVSWFVFFYSRLITIYALQYRYDVFVVCRLGFNTFECRESAFHMHFFLCTVCYKQLHTIVTNNNQQNL